MSPVILVIAALGMALYAAYQLAPSDMRDRLGGPGRRPGARRSAERPVSVPAPPLRPWTVVGLLPVWLAVTLWQTNPLYTHLDTTVPAGMDSGVFVWNLWWMKYALLTLHRFPFYTDYIFAPQQVNLAFHTFTPLSALASIPLQLLVGLNAACNIVLMANFVLSALGAFLLVRQETASSAGAFVGSVVFPFAPYVLAHLNAGHFNIVTTWGVPFFVLFLLRWLRGARVRHAALAGLFLACVGLNDLNQLSYSVTFGVLAVLATLLPRLWALRGSATPLVGAALGQATRRWLLGAVALGGVAAVALAPELVPFADGLRHGWSTVTPLQTSEDFAPDLAGYITPLFLHPLWGRWAGDIASSLHFLDWTKMVFLGYTTLALALISLGRRRAGVGAWWAVTLFYWALSLGPHLHAWGNRYFTLFGATFDIPLPYLLYHTIPLVGGGRIPGYASLMVSLGLAVLAGHGLALLAAMLPWRPAGAALAALAALLVLYESLTAPIPLWSPQPDPVYSLLAREPGRQAVLEAPLGWRDGRIYLGYQDNAQMYYQTVSQKPTVAGFSARVPDSLFTYYQSRPALAGFYAPDQPPTAASMNRAQVLAALRELGVGYIIVHRSPFYNTLVTYMTRVVPARQFYQDADLIAYRVP